MPLHGIDEVVTSRIESKGMRTVRLAICEVKRIARELRRAALPSAVAYTACGKKRVK